MTSTDTYHPRTEFLMARIGVSTRELRAIGHPPKHDFPYNKEGFGLIGNTGTGKTWSLIHALADDVNGLVLKSKQPDDYWLPSEYATWLNWPGRAEQLKSMIGLHENLDISRLVEDWCLCGMLFVDDIGAERVTGDNDYSLGILRTVLDSRYRYERPVYWTSNLNIQPLKDQYGVRMVSRMLQAWPPVVIKGKDLRLNGE